MNRRDYMQTTALPVIAGLAGCVGMNAGSDDTRDPGNTGAQADGDDTGSASLSESDIDWEPTETLLEPEGGILSYSPSVVTFEHVSLTAAISNHGFRTDDGIVVRLEFERGATENDPAQLSAVIANTNDFDLTVETRRLGILDSPADGRSETEQAYLVPTEDHPLADPILPATQDEDGRWVGGPYGGQWYPDLITMPSESGFVTTYSLLGRRPLSTGYYQFHRDRFEIAIWPTDHPLPPVDSRFAGVDRPSLPDRDVTTWYHEATESSEVMLEPDREKIAPTDSIEFTFRNHSHEVISGNPHYYRFSKWVDETWIHIFPLAWTQPLVQIPPGGRHGYQYRIFHGAVPSYTDNRAVGYFGGGVYAFESGFRQPDGPHAAMFEFDAPPLEVTPDPDAQAETEDGTTTVTLPEFEDASRPMTVTVTPEPDLTYGDHRIIPEQLYRPSFSVLRNALAHDTPENEEVRVRSDGSSLAINSLFYDTDSAIVRFQDRVYRVVKASF